MSRLKAEQLHIAYEHKLIVENLNLEIPEGKVTALVGANGSGKSTILKTLARILRLKQGVVYLDGKSIHQESSKHVAKKLAILPQNPVAPDGLTVKELVAFGRSPYQKGLSPLSNLDRKMIDWALNVTGMSVFANRSVDQLSGGQRQRAWIAMAIAQGTSLLLLDEPTTFLDMAHQLEVLMLLKKLNETEKCTIVMVVHDLNHAARFAQYIVAIREGKIIQDGNPHEVITPQMLRQVFRIEADIIIDPRTGIPLCLPFNLVDEASEGTSKSFLSGKSGVEALMPI